MINVGSLPDNNIVTNGSLPNILSNIGSLPNNLTAGSLPHALCFTGSLPNILNNCHVTGSYTVAEWNLMGFRSTKNPANTLFKQVVVEALYHDIYIFPETHSTNDDKVVFTNYEIFSHNRVPPRNVNKGSGGIAIALHLSLVASHTILSVNYGVDGQIALKIKCNITNVTVGVLGLYLSPDSYRYGQNSEEFFNQASFDA